MQSFSCILRWQLQHSPHFSTNVVNAVNFQVNFRNLHHSLQGLKLSCLQLIFEEDVNFDLDVIQNLIFLHDLRHHLRQYLLTSIFTWHFTAKLDFFHYFLHYLHHYLLTSLFTSNFTTKLKCQVYMVFYTHPIFLKISLGL